jgi:probable phosphoglycerate mutase
MGKRSNIRVLFVRTGETDWERAGRIAGSTDVPLTEAGWDRIRAAFQGLGQVRLSSVLCGPDETSQAIARELAKVSGGAKVKVIEDLGEVHLGLWEGILETDLQEKCPTAYRQWVEDPAAVHVPEGEGFEEAQSRLIQALGRGLDRARGDAGAVGVVLRPMALGLVGCALGGVATSGLWSMIESSPALDWKTIGRGTPAGRPTISGVGA